ncbi:MAG TPA: glycosyltransferase [Cyclobacteriaceae bacterium]|nr:glycosyltransferase [Cyclobacteriaceae bacterium]
MKGNRSALAIIIPGGIGTGRGNMGVPVLNGLVKIISAQFDLTVFSLAKINAGYQPEGFELVDAYKSNSVMRVLSFPRLFRKHHRRKKFVAIHGFWVMPAGLLAVLAGKLFGVKSVVSVLGGDAAALPEIGYGRLHKPLVRWLTLLTLSKADHINALTEYLVNNLRAVGFKRAVDVIPWGVNKDLFYYDPKPASLLTVFLHVANLHPVKDQETLLRTFTIITAAIRARLVIVGTGTDHSKVMRLIDELDIKNLVTIHEPILYEYLPVIYHGADVLLHTSLSEGQCEVVTEAMSCGVPVCGTRVGLMHDLPDCCVTVDVRDYKRLAEEAIKLVRDPGRIKELRLRAKQWTSLHDIVWTAEKLMSIYRS